MWEKVESEIANGSYSLICLSIRDIFFRLRRASLNLSRLSLFCLLIIRIFCGESCCMVADQMWGKVVSEIASRSYFLILSSIRDPFVRLHNAS